MPPKSTMPGPGTTAELQTLITQQAAVIADLQADIMGRDLQELSLRVFKRPLVLFFGRATFSDNTKYLYLDTVRAARDYDVLWCASTPALARELHAHGLPCLDMTADLKATVRTLLHCSVAVLCENLLSTFGGNVALAGALAGAQKIQLWHGISVKHLDLMLLPFANVLDQTFRRTIMLASRPDYFLSTAASLDVFWAQAFGATQVIRAGQPRNAVVRRDATPHEMIGAALPSDQMVAMQNPAVRRVLVTPTWKRGQGLFTASAEFHKRLAAWAARTNTVIFVKPHPFMSAAEIPANIPGRLYFLAAGLDIYPWLSRFDALLTDYSSIMFDFLLTGKPIFTFDSLTQVVYGFEPDWSLIPDTPFRYVFDASNMEQVLDAHLDAHPLHATQQVLCDQLFETNPLEASDVLIRVIGECNAMVLDRSVHVIDADVDDAGDAIAASAAAA
jgi:CDP-glycerol glycerophosphotransferase